MVENNYLRLKTLEVVLMAAILLTGVYIFQALRSEYKSVSSITFKKKTAASVPTLDILGKLKSLKPYDVYAKRFEEHDIFSAVTQAPQTSEGGTNQNTPQPY